MACDGVANLDEDLRGCQDGGKQAEKVEKEKWEWVGLAEGEEN